MELNDYLRELKNCPDDRLTGEFGISDNWPILLGTGVDRVVKDLEISGKFRLIYSGIDMSSCLTRGFNYVPGTVYMTVKQGVTKASHFDKKRLENLTQSQFWLSIGISIFQVLLMHTKQLWFKTDQN